MAEQGVVLEDEAHLAAARVAAGHVLVVEEDRPAAGVGLLQAGDDPQQRGLARARGPQQGHQLARAARSGSRRCRATKVPKVLLMLRTSMLMVVLLAFPVRRGPSAGATCHSTSDLATSVTRASKASSEATAKAAA